MVCLDGGASSHVRDLCHLHEAYVLGYAYGTQPRSGRDRQYTKALDVGLCRRAAGRSRCGHDLPMLCVLKHRAREELAFGYAFPDILPVGCK